MPEKNPYRIRNTADCKPPTDALHCTTCPASGGSLVYRECDQRNIDDSPYREYVASWREDVRETVGDFASGSTVQRQSSGESVESKGCNERHDVCDHHRSGDAGHLRPPGRLLTRCQSSGIAFNSFTLSVCLARVKANVQVRGHKNVHTSVARRPRPSGTGARRRLWP